MDEKLNVESGVITVVVCPAFRAIPLPGRQPQVLVDESANVTALAGWEEAVDLMEASPVPLALVRQLTKQFSLSAISNPPGEMVVGQHPLHVQVFGGDDLVLVNHAYASCFLS